MASQSSPRSSGLRRSETNAPYSVPSFDEIARSKDHAVGGVIGWRVCNTPAQEPYDPAAHTARACRRGDRIAACLLQRICRLLALSDGFALDGRPSLSGAKRKCRLRCEPVDLALMTQSRH